jgi:hypothetical protein
MRISPRHAVAPSTNRVLWLREGPWSSRHDVDIVDDHTIAASNNNVFDKGSGARVSGSNNIICYDFAAGQTRAPFSALFETEEIKTMSEGLFALLPDGGVMVEEENFGCLLITDRDDNVKARFIHRAENGEVYRLGWSRVITP